MVMTETTPEVEQFYKLAEATTEMTVALLVFTFLLLIFCFLLMVWVLGMQVRWTNRRCY